MNDLSKTLERYRLPLSRDHLKATGRLATLGRGKLNPFMLLGAAVVGLAGVVAWRNRAKIREAATPVLANASAKSEALIDQAAARGHALIDEARARTKAVASRARNLRRPAAPEIPPAEVH